MISSITTLSVALCTAARFVPIRAVSTKFENPRVILGSVVAALALAIFQTEGRALSLGLVAINVLYTDFRLANPEEVALDLFAKWHAPQAQCDLTDWVKKGRKILEMIENRHTVTPTTERISQVVWALHFHETEFDWINIEDFSGRIRQWWHPEARRSYREPKDLFYGHGNLAFFLQQTGERKIISLKEQDVPFPFGYRKFKYRESDNQTNMVTITLLPEAPS